MLDLSVSELPYELLVSQPTDNKVLTSTTCLDCPITFNRYTSTIDLICIPMIGLNRILGMNWLSTNHILLDCHNKTIRLPTDRQTLASLVEIANSLVHQVEKCVGSETRGCVLLYSLEAASTPHIEQITVSKIFLRCSL